MKKQLPIVIGIAALLGAAAPPAADAAVQSAAVSTVPEGATAYPNSVQNASATWNIGRQLFDISFTAPTTGYYNDPDTYASVEIPLESIEKIEVSVSQGWGSSNVIKTFTAPAPGQQLSLEYGEVERCKSYNFQIRVYAFGLYDYGTDLYSCFAGAVPGKVTDITVTTDRGQLPAVISFKAPETYRDRDDALSSIDRIRLYSESYDWTQYENVIEEHGAVDSPVPGQTYSITVADGLGQGAYSWYIEAQNADGSGDRADVRFYIGTDTPGTVTGIEIAEQTDGSLLLTWAPPVNGSRGGYIDPAALTYDVSLYENDSYSAQQLQTGLTGCSYLYTPAYTEPTIVSFGITASNSTGTGQTMKSGQTIVGPALTLPFAEGFDQQGSYLMNSDHIWGNSTTSAESYPPTWRYDSHAYMGSTEVKPAGESGGLAYINYYDSTPDAEYHLTSSKIDVAGNAYLDFGFAYYHAPANDTQLKALISFDGGAFTPVCAVDFNTDAQQNGWVNVARSVAVPAGAQTACLRFTSVKTGRLTYATVIDNISLKTGTAPQAVYPASVTDLTAEYDKAAKAVNISFKAPLNSHPTLGETNNQPLDHITRIDLMRMVGDGADYSVIRQFMDPAPGATLTYADTDLATGGEYYYKVVTYVDSYCDYGQFLDEPVVIGQIPADVNDLVITSDHGSAPVTLTFTAPAKDTAGDDLEEIRAINVSRYNTDTFVWDDLAPLTDGIVPGRQVTYTDASAVSGRSYQYRVVVAGTAGNSYGTTGTVFVGLDEPLVPEKVRATVNADGTVTVTWTAPAGGLNDGYVDTDNLTYTILRGNGYSDYDATLLREDVRGTSFTDNSEFTRESAVKYFVKATNHGITGSGGISNVVLVGPAPTLPFIENFDAIVAGGTSAEHTTWLATSSESTSGWAFAEMAYLILEGQVQPVDGGNGLAYVYYGVASSDERDDYLASGNINVEGAANPTLTFHVYGVPGYDSRLNVEVSSDQGEFITVKSFDYATDFETAGWQKHTVPLALPEGTGIINLRFHAHKGEYSCSVAIDNIRVEDSIGAIDGVTATGGISISGADGVITARGMADGDTFTVYTPAGTAVAAGKGNCSVAVAPGVYIVRAATAPAVKVIVR